MTFADCTTTTPAVIVWATGYLSDYSIIDVPGATEAAGAPVHHQRGVSPVPGLYFLGLLWQHTRGLALLGFVGAAAAAHVADHMAAASDRT